MTDTTEALPPLPEPEARFSVDSSGRWKENLSGQGMPMFTIEHMHAYARAALAQRQQVPEGWQPIETAPRKDQMRALVAWPIDAGGHYVEEAWFDLARDQWWPANTDYTDSHGSPLYPSHWMPLPAAPAITAAPSAQAERRVECDACPTALGCLGKCMKVVPPAAHAEPQVPLTREQALEVIGNVSNIGDALRILRATEAAHGIGKQEGK